MKNKHKAVENTFTLGDGSVLDRITKKYISRGLQECPKAEKLGRRLRIGIWLRVTKESGHETSRRDMPTDFPQKKIIRGARQGLKKKHV